jgi:prevent-host-death family protein
MGEASIRELRNQGGRVLARVAGGERVVVTSDGEPVAVLLPLPRRPLTAATVQERFRRLPPLDPVRFRADLDAVIDQGL